MKLCQSRQAELLFSASLMHSDQISTHVDCDEPGGYLQGQMSKVKVIMVGNGGNDLVNIIDSKPHSILNKHIT